MGAAPDFSKNNIDALAKRAAQTCSNPSCRKPTSGPHTQEEKSVSTGEAAHIKGARAGSKRYDVCMTDEERAIISNGIWLCRTCAKLIDSDEVRFPVSLLQMWKREHEAWVDAGLSGREVATREISVINGGVGSFISNQGPGTALEITGCQGQTAERIHVQGHGVGEIITNTGPGTAKIVRSSGAQTASESSVTVDHPVGMAAGLISSVILTVCDKCSTQFTVSKVIQGFAGESEPRVQVQCPKCGWSVTI